MSQLISLIIPVYNEAPHLKTFLQSIDDLALPIAKELIFIDDASRDASLSIMQAYPFRSPHRIFVQQPNQGKGAAIRRGITEAKGDIIVIQDADFEYDPQDLVSLLAPLLAGKADVVYGSRFKKSPQVHRTFHYLVNRFLTIMSNLMSGLYLTDMETCYKLFRADIIQNIHLESNRFGFEPEVTAKIARLKLRIHELPISYHPRNYMEGKKITWRDGVAALRHIIHYNTRVKHHKMFKETLPQHYIPRDRNLL